jgi:uncharacterized protein (DUF2126 family)
MCGAFLKVVGCQGFDFYAKLLLQGCNLPLGSCLLVVKTGLSAALVSWIWYRPLWGSSIMSPELGLGTHANRALLEPLYLVATHPHNLLCWADRCAAHRRRDGTACDPTWHDIQEL